MVKAASGAFIQPVADEQSAGLTQWQRVYRAVRAAIDAGALARGARLPSARQLARDWRVARGAVDEAFAQLQLEGAIERRVGDGTYVSRPGAAPPGGVAAAQRGEPTALARRVLKHSAALNVPPSRIECAERTMRTPPLHPRATDVDAFPLDLWRRLVVGTASERRRDLLAEVPAAGLPARCEAIVRHLTLHRGIACKPEQVLVLATPAEGLSLLVRLLMRPGERFWIEDPSHPSLPWLLSSLGAQVRGVPLDAHGFDLDAARASGPAARLVYLHPLNQYPLGIRTTVARGDALLEWAGRQQSWIVEAHFNEELWHRDALPPTLLRRDPERVFMVGTFEGIMFPSLRLAYLIVPPALVEPFTDAQTLWGARAGSTLQAALAEFIDGGHLHEHLAAQRERNAERARIVEQMLLRRLPAGCTHSPLTPVPTACIHLPPRDGAAAAGFDIDLASRLRKRGVFVEPLSPMMWNVPRRPGLVLGYGGWDDVTLRSALARLSEGLHAALDSAAGSMPVAA